MVLSRAQNYYSGGLGSVRGFEQGSLGPTDDTTGDATGGPKKITLNAELITPFPGAGNDRTLRMFGFVDAGNVFGEDNPYRVSDLKVSVGFGLSWISPVGPLRLGVGFPVNKSTDDKMQRLQFQIGSSF